MEENQNKEFGRQYHSPGHTCPWDFKKYKNTLEDKDRDVVITKVKLNISNKCTPYVHRWTSSIREVKSRIDEEFVWYEKK